MMRKAILIVAMAMMALPASATITLRGKLTETENNVATTTLTVTNSGLAISASDMIVVIYRGGNGTAAQVTVADNQNAGNYTKAVEVVDTTNGRTVGIYVHANSVSVVAGSLTVTATSSASVTMGLNGLVYAGGATTSPVDQTNSAIFATATSTPSSGNITTVVSGDAVVGAFGLTTSATVTVSSEGGSFAQEFNDTIGTTAHQHLHTADQILVGTSTLAYAPTLSGTSTGIIAVASFKPVVVAGGAPSPLSLTGVGMASNKKGENDEDANAGWAAVDGDAAERSERDGGACAIYLRRFDAGGGNGFRFERGFEYQR